MRYEAVIGLEVHAELDTRTKLFCGCGTGFGAPPNTQVCPVCLGMPGVLPVMNRVAFEYALRMALALNCEIADRTRFDRKNYYYPDLPKNYQISQSCHNLGEKGWAEILVDGRVKKVGIWNVHLEEDAGKLIHSEAPGDRFSLVDLNRAGQPLLEIVTAPDMRSAEEADAFMRMLRTLLLYTGVCTCRIQEGKLRFEPSVSLRPEGAEALGARVEIKNIGSISAAVKTIEYETERQTRLLEGGEIPAQETRLWDEQLERTTAMRRKETSADYRYFPEPDLVEVVLDEAWIMRARAAVPELPTTRRLRFEKTLGLSPYDAGVLSDDRAVADYFEACLAESAGSPKAVANWVTNDVLRFLGEREQDIAAFPCPPGRIGALAAMVEKGVLYVSTAREVFAEMIESDQDPAEIVEARGLKQISDADAIETIVDAVISDHPKVVADWKAGKKAAANALIGPVMRATKGKANPRVVRETLQKRLDVL